MHLKALREMVKEWDMTNPDERPSAASKFQSILDRLEWFGEIEWSEYTPAHNPEYSTSYMTRLAGWIGNVKRAEDCKLLLEYSLQLSFFSHEDLFALYQAAFSGPITRWIIEQEGLSLFDSEFQTRLSDELHKRTWYCPVTESMNISDFCHINQISGISYQPRFRNLKKFGHAGLKCFIQAPNPTNSAPPLKRLVLLEDFVGSGTQVSGPITWAASKLDIPILFVPLVICAPGARQLEKIGKKFVSKLHVSPLITLAERDLLGPKRNGVDGMANADQIERLARDTFEQVAGGLHTNKNTPPHTAFGYRQTGSSFVTYSNTSNNTLPLIHHKPKTGSWQPLFPRSARVQ